MTTKNLKNINLLAIASVALFFVVGFWACGSLDESTCPDAGFLAAPFFLFVLVLVPTALFIDAIAVFRRVLPQHYKRLAPVLVLVAIGIYIVLFTIHVHNRNEYKHHFPASEAVKLIDNCQISSVSDESGYVSVSTTTDAGDLSDIRVAATGRPQLVAALERSHIKCHYIADYGNSTDFNTATTVNKQ